MLSPSPLRRSIPVRLALAVALATCILVAGAGDALATGFAHVRVEGSQRTYFEGAAPLGAATMLDTVGGSHVEVANPLSALDAASQVSAFPYVLKDSGWGLYVDSIGGELPVPVSPWPGWLFRVNGVLPSVGADSVALHAGDDVLWFYGTYDEPEAVAVTPSSYVAVGATATVLAEQLDTTGTPSALPTATVGVGSQVATAADDGAAGFRMTRPGDFAVRVQKDGVIRSAIAWVHVRYATAISSLRVSRTNIRRGTRVRLFGTLAGSGKTPAARIVTVVGRRKGSTKWTVSTRAMTTAGGGFSCWVTPSASTYYRVTFGGDGQFAAATGGACAVTVR